MKIAAFVIVALGLAGGAFWIGKTRAGCPPGHVCILQGNTDPSPIIITDGNSIHFAQYDQWLYEDTNLISALLPGHHTHSVKVGLCAPNSNTAAGTCDPDLINQKVAGKSWILYLCQTACSIDGSNSVASISLDKDSTWGSDKGIDVVVKSKPNFQPEPRSKDGASFYLDTAHFLYALLIVTQDDGSKVPTPADCSGSNPPSKACVARVCYSSNPTKCL